MDITPLLLTNPNTNPHQRCRRLVQQRVGREGGTDWASERMGRRRIEKQEVVHMGGTKLIEAK